MKKLIIILAAMAAVILLSACSGVIGGETSVVFSISDGRHVSADAVEGYLMALKPGEKNVYSYNNFTGVAYQALEDGKAVIANLPVGDYIFGVALLDADEDNVGFAVKKYTVKRGLNTLAIEVAPGISNLQIEGAIGNISIDNFLDPPDDIESIAFSENEVTVDYDRPSSGGTDIDFDVTFGDGSLISTLNYTTIGSGTAGTGGSLTLADGDSGVEFRCSFGDQEYIYRLILK